MDFSSGQNHAGRKGCLVGSGRLTSIHLGRKVLDLCFRFRSIGFGTGLDIVWLDGLAL